jgi:hypothetical protein
MASESPTIPNGTLDSMACGTWESAERVFMLARNR